MSLLRLLVVGSGALVVLGTVVIVEAMLRRRWASDRIVAHATRWREVGQLVEEFCNGKEGSEARLGQSLTRNRTRTLTVHALADRIRADPDLGRLFRGRDSELSLLRRWATQQLSQKDEEVRREAAEVIGTLRMRSCTELLLVTLDNSNQDRTRETICRALVTLDPAAAIGVLLRLLDRDAPNWVADLLGIAMSRGDLDAPWRRAVHARLAAGHYSPSILRLVDGPSEGTSAVLHSLLHSADVDLRVLALGPMAAAGDPVPFTDALLEGLSDPQPSVQLAAARAVETLARRAGIRLETGLGLRLLALVGHDDRAIRCAAAAALCSIDPSGTLLRQIADTGDRQAAETAKIALALAEALGNQVKRPPSTKPRAKRKTVPAALPASAARLAAPGQPSIAR